MASQRQGTLYTGSTRDLARRAFEHREVVLPGFTRRYGCKRLVWYEAYESIGAAYQREKTIKHYSRAWKINLIEAHNPYWLDLYNRLNWRARVGVAPWAPGTSPEERRRVWAPASLPDGAWVPFVARLHQRR